MALYATHLGKRVEVRYRSGQAQLPASGMLVADSGRSIFLEERFTENTAVKSFRWEIPYECIVEVAEQSRFRS